ncbi:MAG: glycosyltransferase family 9 protein [Chloroflexota bacterium]
MKRDQSFAPPRKALILKPCCLSQVLLATPLLAVLSETFPQARFDWAVSEWARQAIAANPRLKELIPTGRVGLPGGRWADVRQLAQQLRQEEYDTCFIPSRSGWLGLAAWLAGIPRRIGLNVGGRGLTHTIRVRPPAGQLHEAAVYLSLARALGIEREMGMEYYPPPDDRAAVTQRLVDELNWLGDAPLIVIHPGGGQNPVRPDASKRWPPERFALLGNHLARAHQARVLLVGATNERPLAQTIAGLMSSPAVNLAGRLSLGALGALGEVADLYVGNDTGPTHVAAAVGCPTLAIFGPSDPAVSAPYATKGHVVALWRDGGTPFTWANGVTVSEAIAAADTLLAATKNVKRET